MIEMVSRKYPCYGEISRVMRSEFGGLGRKVFGKQCYILPPLEGHCEAIAFRRKALHRFSEAVDSMICSTRNESTVACLNFLAGTLLSNKTSSSA